MGPFYSSSFPIFLSISSDVVSASSAGYTGALHYLNYVGSFWQFSLFLRQLYLELHWRLHDEDAV